MYNPPSNVRNEYLIRTYISDYLSNNPPSIPLPHVGPVWLSVVFAFPFPVSQSVRFPGMEKTSRPDLENCLKAVMDALNGVLWRDDAQIANLSAYKIYDESGYIWIQARFYPELERRRRGN